MPPATWCRNASACWSTTESWSGCSTATVRRYEYTLTDKGSGLHPVIVSLLAWGDQWMPHEDGRSLTLVHEPCAAVTPELRCPHCDGRIEPADASIVRRA